MGKNMVMFLKNFGEAFGYQLLGDITKYSCTGVLIVHRLYIYIHVQIPVYIYMSCLYAHTSEHLIQLCWKYHNMIVGVYLQALRFAPFKTSQGLRIRVEQRSTEVDFRTTRVFFKELPPPPPKKNE